MTRRMLAAVETRSSTSSATAPGGSSSGAGRPQSTFDHDAVFAGLRPTDTAVEINSRPDRLDPPDGCSSGRSRGLPVRDRLRRPRPRAAAWLAFGCRAGGRGRHSGRIDRQPDGLEDFWPGRPATAERAGISGSGPGAVAQGAPRLRLKKSAISGKISRRSPPSHLRVPADDRHNQRDPGWSPRGALL